MGFISVAYVTSFLADAGGSLLASILTFSFSAARAARRETEKTVPRHSVSNLRVINFWYIRRRPCHRSSISSKENFDKLGCLEPFAHSVRHFIEIRLPKARAGF